MQLQPSQGPLLWHCLMQGCMHACECVCVYLCLSHIHTYPERDRERDRAKREGNGASTASRVHRVWFGDSTLNRPIGVWLCVMLKDFSLVKKPMKLGSYTSKYTR